MINIVVTLILVFLDLSKDQRTVQEHNYSMEERQLSPFTQTTDVKKIIFIACHSGKLKLAFTSPDIISTSPKSFFKSRIDFSQFLCYSNSSKNITCPSGKLKTELTSPIAKSTSPGLLDTIFFARWVIHLMSYIFFKWSCKPNDKQ